MWPERSEQGGEWQEGKSESDRAGTDNQGWCFAYFIVYVNHLRDSLKAGSDSVGLREHMILYF